MDCAVTVAVAAAPPLVVRMGADSSVLVRKLQIYPYKEELMAAIEKISNSHHCRRNGIGVSATHDSSQGSSKRSGRSFRPDCSICVFLVFLFVLKYYYFNLLMFDLE